MRALSVAGLLLALAGCGGDAPTPLPSAPPDIVLRSYLQAWQLGRCAGGRVYVADTFRKGNGELCPDVRLLSAEVNPDPATPTDDEAVFGVTITTTGSPDGSVAAGRTLWFFDLRRQPDGAWRIAGGGSGP